MKYWQETLCQKRKNIWKTYATLTPNKYPTPAVRAMATVPQNVILSIAFLTDEPPAFAAAAPKTPRNKIDKPYK